MAHGPSWSLDERHQLTVHGLQGGSPAANGLKKNLALKTTFLVQKMYFVPPKVVHVISSHHACVVVYYCIWGFFVLV